MAEHDLRRVAVLNVVGLTPRLLRSGHMPRLAAFAASKTADGASRVVRPIDPVLPAVTCSVQSTYLTGLPPSGHGIVANGWYDRESAEVRFWRQSNRLVAGEKLWETAKRRDPSFTCANLFWWFAMYADTDYTVTPRPTYPADGRKVPDLWTHPPALRASLQREFGQFPLFRFWGPTADVASTRWIVDAAIRVERDADPTLLLVYLPHLDYDLQRFGPESPQARVAATEVDVEAVLLIDALLARGREVIVLSEYGITSVDTPVHLNRRLREAGLLAIREELGRETLDAGASRAFAVADHQVAHVYVRDASDLESVERLLRETPGVGRVVGGDARRDIGLNHARSGDFVAIADEGCWFTYYFWDDERRAPDYARTVDIHRKPGYDPVELRFDRRLYAPRVRAGVTLFRRNVLGQRALLDVIGTDATIVRGSHGRLPVSAEDGAVLVVPERQPGNKVPQGTTSIPATAIRDELLRTVFRTP